MRSLFALFLVVVLASSGRAQSNPSQGVFYRGINLNGPSLTIDGQLWEAHDSPYLDCQDARFENQSIPLIPATDDARAQMIRSSRWSPEGHNRVVLARIEPGRYELYLYVWEDNDSQTFDVLINDQIVQPKVISGAAGEWQKLGPFPVDISGESVVVTSSGGHANFSGIELWRAGPPLPPRPTDPVAIQHFDTHVASIFARHCLECHNANDHKGSLDLTNYTAAMRGGESGVVLVPGKIDESLMWTKISAGEMPPDDPLPADEVATIREWIAAGAQWGTERIDPFRFSSKTRGGYDWWSLQPIVRQEPPMVQHASWPRGSIDRFVLAKMEAAGLEPSPPADRVTLVRRVYFDLIGLPPTPEEVAAFVNDESADAYPRLVDRLLASPAYGERWARHWLDVVRFGESQGFERNKMRDHAWKYRDWVVEALNSDLPYDEFVRLQLAGDVLQPDDPLAVIASGFLVMGPYDLTAYTDGTAAMKAFAREEELEGLIGTVCQTFMGLTVNCARCHDHKFDAIAQREYYQIGSALAGTQHGDERECLSDAGKAAAAQRVETIKAEVTALRERLAMSVDAEKSQLEAQIRRLESLARLLDGGPAHLTVPKEPGVLHVLARGDFKEPREAVKPDGIAAIAGPAIDWKIAADAPEGERRRALAAWITDPSNPLTARVIANRIWNYHFGTGLVATPNDFGFNGGRPSHPELLDWLASELATPQENAGEPAGSSIPPWSLKHLHRLILLSAIYQQSSKQLPSAMQIDADNRLLWRHQPHRLEAESMRDAVLAVSGQLNPTFGGPGFRDYKTSAASQNQIYEVFDAEGAEFNRRSIYRTWIRTGTNPFLDVLDCPDPSVATPRRNVTTTPLQALSLLNNAFMERNAQAWAARLQSSNADVPGQIDRAYREALARAPTDEDRAFADEFIAQHGLPQFCLVLFNTNEFLYID